MPRSWSYRKYQRDVLTPPRKGIAPAVIAIAIVSAILLTFFIGSTIFYFVLDAKKTPKLVAHARPTPNLKAPEIRD